MPPMVTPAKRAARLAKEKGAHEGLALLIRSRRDFNGGNAFRFEPETFSRRGRDVDDPVAFEWPAIIYRDDDRTMVAQIGHSRARPISFGAHNGKVHR